MRSEAFSLSSAHFASQSTLSASCGGCAGGSSDTGGGAGAGGGGLSGAGGIAFDGAGAAHDTSLEGGGTA